MERGSIEDTSSLASKHKLIFLPAFLGISDPCQNQPQAWTKPNPALLCKLTGVIWDLMISYCLRYLSLSSKIIL